MKRWHLSKEEKSFLISSIMHYYEHERGEPIGELAADGILEFMLSTIGLYGYNKGLEDARRTLAERMQSLEDELYALQQPLR
ncbi:DUF2164 domain-containing protein [Paenibacillus beijingensis]|uniref:DUF2164 domain-containing protein n=1 Tax=Paenibacillus beijingensis TaxID=1126833 RepID=A0A0D5NEE1_9BACL|nr:DUF2164 domain-containing protein [Paenibacillus beijingensis]AJY73337.1 hypothetical protein VN24_00210 [Paenibacillus beijingensis]